jgi:hypothetical protein
MNEGLSEEFFKRHLDKVDLGWLSMNDRLSLDFHKSHLGKLKICGINLHRTVLNKIKRTEYYYFDKLIKK